MWTPTYDITELCITAEQDNDGSAWLILEVMGFHREKYLLAPLYENSGLLNNPEWTFQKKAAVLVDYILDNALFPYPVEELT